MLGLCLSADQKLLFSSAGDRIVNAWCTEKFHRIYSIYSSYDIGDIFCVAYASSIQTVYLGAQNTSIQWYDLREKESRPAPKQAAHPDFRQDRFFDSFGPGGFKTPRLHEEDHPKHAVGGQVLELDKQYIRNFAHYGYVNCMLVTTGSAVSSPSREILISGGGDGAIKLWALDADNGGAITELAALGDEDEAGEAVLSIAIDGDFLFSGRSNGEVNIWDLETKQIVRSLQADTEDVLALSVGRGLLFASGVTGSVQKFNSRYEHINTFKAHSGRILASAWIVKGGRPTLVTGGNDDSISVWDIRDCTTSDTSRDRSNNEQLVESLRQFVAHRSVSSDPRCQVDCRSGAAFLRSVFKNFGAQTEVLSTDDPFCPVIFARFRGNPNLASKRKKILYYGHYDVIAADDKGKKWRSDPFALTGADGYLYGRGASDNKGPIMAAIYAVGELVAAKQLDSDIIFLIEGEEERGSKGFAKAVQANKQLIGNVDWILLANSYWLDDYVPCLTYGLRGVIHATVKVESKHPDLHSGVDGSALLDEALKDLVMLLSKLTGKNGKVDIPGFYDSIPPVSGEERKLYKDITRTLLERNPDLSTPAELEASLMRRWREASLTIHRFKTSGPENSTIIPRLAQASLSIRLVPNQEVSEIAQALTEFLQDEFDRLGTKNKLTITIDHRAEPWLGDVNNELFRTLEEAITEVWGPVVKQRRHSSVHSRKISLGKTNGYFPSAKSIDSPATSSTLANSSVETEADGSAGVDDDDEPSPIHDPGARRPLYIREGGSIPSIRFLEKEFDAPAAHLPCGQASDNAHLDNERLRLLNLYKSKDIFKKVFRDLPGR